MASTKHLSLMTILPNPALHAPELSSNLETPTRPGGRIPWPRRRRRRRRRRRMMMMMMMMWLITDL